MKYLLLGLLLIGCATKKKPIPKPPETPNRKERLMKCVDRYLDKDVPIKEAFETCKGIYKRG